MFGILFSKLEFNFDTQFSIRNIENTNDKWYKFDFYFPSTRIAIEYNGAQHYRPVKFGGKSISASNIDFINQVKRDNYVRNFCKKNNILLIEIDGRKYKFDSLIKHINNVIIPIINKGANLKRENGYKIYSEKETRAKMRDLAIHIGAVKEYDLLIVDIDRKMSTIKNPIELEQYKMEAVKTLELLLSGKPEDVMYNGKIITF